MTPDELKKRWLATYDDCIRRGKSVVDAKKEADDGEAILIERFGRIEKPAE